MQTEKAKDAELNTSKNDGYQELFKKLNFCLQNQKFNFSKINAIKNKHYKVIEKMGIYGMKLIKTKMCPKLLSDRLIFGCAMGKKVYIFDVTFLTGIFRYFI